MAMPVIGEGPALDLGGERGEYHTMCVDGPLYQHPIAVAAADGATGATGATGAGARRLERAHTAGLKEGDDWWVLDSDYYADVAASR